jgi:hypothetical protein
MPIAFDVLKDSAFESGTNFIRVTRSAVVSGLDPSPGYDVMIRAIAQPGVPQVGDLHPSVIGARVVGYRIRFETDSIVRLDVQYETPQSSAGGTQIGVLTLRDSTTLQSIQTQINPAAPAPIQAIYTSYKNPNDPNDPGNTLPGSVDFLRPMRVLTASGTFAARPSIAALNAIGTVNVTDWQGLPAGYWLLTSLDASTRDGGRTFDWNVAWTTRNVEDWASYVIEKDGLGNPVTIKPADLQALRAAPYLPLNTQANGITRVGPYKMSDMRTIFGI